jgi:hypothetical protein
VLTDKENEVNMNIGDKLKKIFNPKPIAGFVSEIDEFLEEFNRTHPLSQSQIDEVNKHKRVAELRDKPVQDNLR